MATIKILFNMNYNKTKDFLKSLSREIDDLVTKIGVIKIVLIIGLFVLVNFMIGAYFNDFLSKFHILTLMVIAFLIISLENDSKIKYLGVWIGSILGVIFSVVVILMLIYGAGEALIDTIFGWFN